MQLAVYSSLGLVVVFCGRIRTPFLVVTCVWETFMVVPIRVDVKLWDVFHSAPRAISLNQGRLQFDVKDALWVRITLTQKLSYFMQTTDNKRNMCSKFEMNAEARRVQGELHGFITECLHESKGAESYSTTTLKKNRSGVTTCTAKFSYTPCRLKPKDPEIEFMDWSDVEDVPIPMESGPYSEYAFADDCVIPTRSIRCAGVHTNVEIEGDWRVCPLGHVCLNDARIFEPFALEDDLYHEDGKCWWTDPCHDKCYLQRRELEERCEVLCFKEDEDLDLLDEMIAKARIMRLELEIERDDRRGIAPRDGKCCTWYGCERRQACSSCERCIVDCMLSVNCRFTYDDYQSWLAVGVINHHTDLDKYEPFQTEMPIPNYDQKLANGEYCFPYVVRCRELWNHCKRSRQLVTTGPAHMEFGHNHNFGPVKVEHSINIPGLDRIAEMLSAKRDDVDWTKILKDLGFCLSYIVTSHFDMTLSTIAVTHFITTLPIAQECVLGLLDKIKLIFSPNAHAFDANPLVSLCGVIGVIIATIGVGQIPDDKSTNAFIFKLSKIGACIKSVETMEAWIRPALEQIIDFVRVKFFGYNSEMMDQWKDYREWCAEVAALNTTDFEQKMMSDPTVVANINTLMFRADNILKTLDHLKVPPAQRTQFTAHYMWLTRMRTEASHSPAGMHVARIPPVVFHIVGETGIGKSELMNYLHSDLLISLGYKQWADLHSLIYFRDASEDRFDGYRNEHVGTAIDDFGSRVDSQANPSKEPFEAIRMQNSAPWQLPMASLSEKGSVFFKSKFVTWTSNRATFKFPSLTNPEAVVRRVNLRFVAKPRPEFAKSTTYGKEQLTMLDVAKVIEAKKENPHIMSDVWLFDQVCPRSDAAPGKYVVMQKDLTYRQMSDMCIAELAEQQARGTDKINDSEEYFKRRVLETTGPAQGCWDNILYTLGVGRSTDDFIDLDITTVIDEDEFVDEDGLNVKYTCNIPDIINESPHDFFTLLHNAAWVRIPMRIERRFRNCYKTALEAMDQMIRAGGTPAEQQKRFNDVFWTVGLIPPSKIEAGEGEIPVDYWLKVKRWAEQRWRKANQEFTKMKNDHPEWWAVAYEAGMFIFRVGVWMLFFRFLAKAVFFFFPKLTPEYQEKQKELEEFERLYKYAPTSALCVAIDDLKRELEQMAPSREGVSEARAAIARAAHAEARPHVAEGHVLMDRAKTTVKDLADDLEKVAKSAESHQDRTGAARRNNVEDSESHQTKTPGASKSNVECGGMVGLPDGMKLPTCRGRGIYPDKVWKAPEVPDQYWECMCKTDCSCTTGALFAGETLSNGNTPMIWEFNEERRGDLIMDKEWAKRTNAEATNDESAQQMVHKALKNLYGVFRKSETGTHFVGNLVVLNGRVALTNRHILEAIKGHDVLLRNGRIKDWIIPKEDVDGFIFPSGEYHDKKDVGLWELPSHVSIHANITKMFMTKEDFSRHKTLKEVCVVGFNVDGIVCSRQSDVVQAIDREEFNLNNLGKVTKVREWYRYGVHSRPGDCGSIAVAYDSAFERKLIGIHMAGYDQGAYHGVAVAVHAELLQSLVDEMKKNLKHAASWMDGTAHGGAEAVDANIGSFENYGNVPVKTSSGKSTIQRSSLYGFIAEPTTKPAKLKPFIKDGEVVDPLEMARKKADTPNVPVDQTILKQCVHHYTQKLLDLKQKSDDEANLTWEEAIKGKEDEWYQPIKRNTSPGYGWPAGNKTKYLGENETYVTDHPEVLAKRDEYMKRLMAGQRAGGIFTDSLKDERRSIEKVEAGKTRLYAAAEMVWCIIFRQYFMGFNAHVMRNCIAAESCVGINPFGMQWSQLADLMRTKGKHVVAGDFSNYDGTLSSAVLWACLDVVESFYKNSTAEERLIRRGLWCDIVNSLHVTVPFEGLKHGKVGILYAWTHSQPSGNPMTVILNSIYHSIVARYVYKLCALKYSPEHFGLDSWDRHVAHASYGDDDLYNISDEIIGWFNQKTMSEGFLELGMVYTDECKTNTSGLSRRLEEVAFLKRRFVYDRVRGRWRCPHQLEVIREMPMWVKRKKDQDQVVAETLEEAVHELAQFSEEEFNEYVGIFHEAREKVKRKCSVTFLTWQEYQDVEECRLGRFVKLRDRAEKEIAEKLLGTAAVSARFGGGWESCLALARHVCPSQTIGFDAGTSAAGSGGPAHSTLKHSPAEQSTETNTTTMLNEQTHTVEEQEIVTFVEEGEVSTTDVAPTGQRVFAKLNDLDDTTTNDIKGFLERPIHVKDFEWLSSQPDAVELWKLQLPRDWLAAKMIREKLAGFRYLRCDLKVRVQINAQPFNAGMLLLVYVPLEEQQQETTTSLASFSGLTGYRNVKLDLATDTSCEITIPFIGTISHWDLVQQYGSMGALKLMVYSPLTGLEDVDGTVWIWAENIQVSLPTGVPTPLVTTGDAHGRHTTSGAAAGPTPKDAAVTTKKKGKIGAIAGTIGSIAHAVEDVPIIGGVATAVGWAADAVSSVANFFGFSKPNDSAVPSKQTLVVANNFANYDGDSKIKSLAFSWANETEMPVDVFGETEDEMSFKHILSREVYMDRFAMTAAEKQGRLLWKWPVDPMSCRKLRRNNASVTPYYPNHYYCENSYLSYLANFFAFWRGTIVYKFRVIKTAFHSGRIRVTVVPGATPDTDPATIDLNKNHSTIYDLRDTTEFCLSVPYKWNTPWKSLDGSFGVDSGDTALTPNTPTAMIYVTVVNSLRNPSTAADHISFIVETSAGEDFQFAFPRTRNKVLLIPTEEQLRRDFPAKPALVSSGPAHAGEIQTLDAAPSDQLSANKIAMGEVITGWRALLKRYSKYLTYTQVEGNFTVEPYRTAALGSTTDDFDLWSAAEALYRFVSGSVILSVVPDFPDSGRPSIVSVHTIDRHNEYDVRRTTSPQVVQSLILEPVVELGVPFYQETPAIPTHVGKPSQSDTSDVRSNFGALPFNNGTTLTSSVNGTIWRASAEDFSFGYLIGPPATLIEHETDPSFPCDPTWKTIFDILDKNLQLRITSAARTLVPHKLDGIQQVFEEGISKILKGETAPAGISAIREEFFKELTDNFVNLPFGAEANAAGQAHWAKAKRLLFTEFSDRCVLTPV